MPDYLLYHAGTTDEVNACAYSLVRYLDIYNVKPPANHALVIYTSKPAMLEAYGTFFSSFELREIGNKDSGMVMDKLDTIRDFSAQCTDNILFLDTNTYPRKELEPLFSEIGRGSLFLKKNQNGEAGGMKDQVSVLGFRNSKRFPVEEVLQLSTAKNTDDYIGQYGELKEFSLLLREFFKRYQEESVPNQVKLLHNTDALRILEQKKKFSSLPLYVRMLRKLTGKGWDISRYIPRI
jgi:hypothetical protein